MKIRSINQLQDFLDSDFAWRLKDISALNSAVKVSKSLSKSTVIRAGVPLLYAHWEGFVKTAFEAYVSFVSLKRLKNEELASCFLVFGAKRHIENLESSKRADINIEAVEFFRTKMSERYKLSLSSAVNTESNLSSGVFENIATSVGVDHTKYASRYNLIDSSLLNRRNKIAHGEYLELDSRSYRNLADDVLMLIRWVKTDIENAASNQTYKRA